MKTRFCPSPTGMMHLGNARTALFNFLAARAAEGEFLLRIEDTDRERSKAEYTDQLLNDLKTLHIVWHEGVGVDADETAKLDHGNGPYHQSERQDIYDDRYEILQKGGHAYPCFCSEDRLKLLRKVQLSSGKPPRYDRKCLALSKEEIQEKLDAGEKPTLRFKLPANETIKFVDLVRGEQAFDSNDLSDFVIRRADGTAPFMYGNALDDALMGVTHAFRGEDHLTNTPRQIILLKTLELTAPSYGHISLIVGSDGAKLSKRHGSKSVGELLADGYLPEALLNYLSRLGHVYSETGFMSTEELARNFKVENLTKSPAKFDFKQLEHWQKEAVSRLAEDEFWAWVGSDVVSSLGSENMSLLYETVKPNVVFPKEVEALAKIFFDDVINVDEEAKLVLEKTDSDFFTKLKDAVSSHGDDYQKITAALKESGFKGKGLFQPLRSVITGTLHGPELVNVFKLMGKERLLKRIESVAK